MVSLHTTNFVCIASIGLVLLVGLVWFGYVWHNLLDVVPVTGPGASESGAQRPARQPVQAGLSEVCIGPAAGTATGQYSAGQGDWHWGRERPVLSVYQGSD